MIDARAVIDPAARLGRDVHVGPWAVIGPGVELGDGCEVGAHVVLPSPARFGRRNRFLPFSVVGSVAAAAETVATAPGVLSGDDCLFREGAIVDTAWGSNGPTALGRGVRVGPQVHVGSSAWLGDTVELGAGVIVSPHGVLGPGVSARAGAHLTRSVPPFLCVAGNPACAVAINRSAFEALGVPAERTAAMVELLPSLCTGAPEAGSNARFAALAEGVAALRLWLERPPSALGSVSVRWDHA